MNLTPRAVLEALVVPFHFARRPVPVPGDLRAPWKIPLLVAMLDRCCRGNRSSVRRLHVLNWAVRSPEHAATLLGALDGTLDPTMVLVRLDPSLNRAIDRARGLRLVALPKGHRVVLTAAGIRLARNLSGAKALAAELAILSNIGHQLSEKQTDAILRWYSS